MIDSSLNSPLAPVLRKGDWINGMALDAVAVAVVWMGVFARMTGARLDLANAVVLGAVVWLVYMADRWLDGRMGAGTGRRHEFARQQAIWLLPVMGLVAAGAAWLALHRMRWITVQAGLWLAAAVGFYFVIVGLSRWKAVSQGLLLIVGGVMVLGLVQGEAGSPGGQQWRALAAGILLATLYFGMRQHFDPPPWILVKKALGGYLFAVGVGLSPFSHLQDWDGLVHGAPILLFAGACWLNSLGIRLGEQGGADQSELAWLGKLYPWLLGCIGLGAGAQAWAADAWKAPVLLGVAACCAGFAVLHGFRQRWGGTAFGLLADGWMVLVGLGVLRFGS